MCVHQGHLSCDRAMGLAFTLGSASTCQVDGAGVRSARRLLSAVSVPNKDKSKYNDYIKLMSVLVSSCLLFTSLKSRC
jgi:hypothetical protein